jgi:excisionase family DNA binding protein
MEERSDEQTSFETVTSLPHLPGYLSVKEAARLLGVSERSVYGYIESGKIPAARIGHLLVVPAEQVSAYQRKAPGRLRTNTPVWHVPPLNNLQYLTSITVKIRQGQGAQLEQKLNEIRVSGKHLLPCTAARYIVRSRDKPDEVEIVLIWRSAIMPPTDKREAALAALRADLIEILAWETSIYRESQVIMHA